MNVGGHRITNDDLVAIIGSLGLRNVSAYQASGNVLFDRGDRAVHDLEHLIETGLDGALGYAVPTHVRTAEELEAVLDTQPYVSAAPQPAGKRQIAFFKVELSPEQITELEALAPKGDQLSVVGREVFWWPDGGLSDSTMDWAAINRTVGPLTMRTRTTVERITKRLSTA
jgi:uncharacterized protein (DUF1697 family)